MFKKPNIPRLKFFQAKEELTEKKGSEYKLEKLLEPGFVVVKNNFNHTPAQGMKAPPNSPKKDETPRVKTP